MKKFNFCKPLSLLLAATMLFSMVPAQAGTILDQLIEAPERQELPPATEAVLPAAEAASASLSALPDADEPLPLSLSETTTGYKECTGVAITAGTYLIYSQVGARNLHADSSKTGQCMNPAPSNGYQTLGHNNSNDHLWRIAKAKDSDGHFTIMSVSLNLYVTGTATGNQLVLGSENDALHFTFDYTDKEWQNEEWHDGYHFKTTDNQYFYWDRNTQGWALSDTSKVVSLYVVERDVPLAEDRSIDLSVYQTYSQLIDWVTPDSDWLAAAQTAIAAADSSVVQISLTEDDDGNHYLTYIGIADGTTSFTLDSGTFTITVSSSGVAGSTKDILVVAGSTAQDTVQNATASLTVETNTDPSVATAAISSVQDTQTITGAQGYKQTSQNNYSSDATPLAKALWRFDQNNDGETYVISNSYTDAGTLYMQLGISGKPVQTTPHNFKVVTATNDSTELALRDTDAGKYLFFHRTDNNNRYDHNDNWMDGSALQFFRPAKSGAQSSTEIPGYVRITSPNDVKDGGEYLLAAPNASNNAYFVLYPTTGSNYEHVLQVDTSLSSVSTTLPCPTYTHTITFTGLAQGETTIKVGDVIYSVQVSRPGATQGTLSISGDLSKPYDGSPVDPATLTITKNNEHGVVAFQFFDNADCVGALSEIPKNAGTYYVKAFMAEDEENNFTAAQSDALSFTISATAVTITDVKQTGDILYTTSLPDALPLITYSNPTNIPGTFSLKGVTSFTPGKALYDWVFTPSDSNYATVEGTVTLTITTPDYRPAGGTTSDQPFAPGTGGSNYFRIPAIITLKNQKDTAKNGRVLAAIDARWNHGADGSNLDTIASYSDDNGKTWSWSYPNYFEDSGDSGDAKSSTFIDPALVEAPDGTVYMLTDLYPTNVSITGGGNQPQCTSGYIEINGVKRLVVYTSTDNSAQTDTSYSYYVGDFNSDGFAPLFAKDTTSGAKYYVDRYYYLYDSNKDQLYCTRRNVSTTQYVRQNLFFENAILHVRNATYLWLTSSTDGGETWGNPMLLNDQVKTDDQRFFGVGPGAGLCLNDGTLVFPAYTNSTERACFIYSTDGKTWHRSENATADFWSSESFLLQLNDTTLRHFYRCGYNSLYYTDHTLVNGTWKAGTPVNTGAVIRYGTQLSGIIYSEKIDGKTAIIVSAPTNTEARQHGQFYTFLLNDDLTMDHVYSYEINGETDYYAYSTLTELNDGRLALIYESSGANVTYKVFNLKDIVPGALLEDGTLSLTLEQYVTYTHSYGFTPTQAELDALKTNAYADITVETAASGGVKLTILGKKTGTASFTLAGNTFNLTITAPDTINVSTAVGQSVTAHAGSTNITMVCDSSIATASFERKNCFNVTGAQGGLGNTVEMNSSYVPLSDALFLFTGSYEDGFTISRCNDDGSKVYLANLDQTAGYPISKTEATIKVYTAGDDEVYLQNPNVNGGNGSYLYFHRDANPHFNRQTGYDNNCKFLFYRPVKDGETSSTEIPGYVLVSGKTGVTSGEYYLIVAYNSTTDAYYALYPTTNASSLYGQVIRVASEKTDAVTGYVPTAAIYYDLLVTGKAVGETYLTIDDQVYHITVTDCISISAETTGGAGKVREITVLGDFDGTRYLVVQITEGTGESARVSVMMLPLSGKNPKAKISYKTSATVNVLLTDGMPDLTGSGNAGASIIASASASAN